MTMSYDNHQQKQQQKQQRQRRRLVLAGVYFLLQVHFSKAFCSFTRISTTTSPSLSYHAHLRLFVMRDNDNIRAGASGYSLLRQPVQWDPNATPDFPIPAFVDETMDSPKRLDESWMMAPNRGGTTNPPAFQRNKPSSIVTPPSEPLNLVQRTLDTLDYPLVLQALRQECGTVPARDSILGCTLITHQQSSSQSRAYQPLTADSHEGLQERYIAVQEMQYLVDNQYSHRIGDAHYRNGKGYKEPLGAPPMGGMTFDLKNILATSDAGQVLEGPDVLEIASMMHVFEDLTKWGAALNTVDSIDFVELPKFVDCISVNTTLKDLLDRAFDKEGRLSGTTFPAIAVLRAKVKTGKGNILQTLDTLLKSPAIQNKLATESGGPLYSEVNGRIVIPMDRSSSVGIVHDASRSGKTVYVEPTEIVGPTNALRQAEAELRTEEARVWRLLTGEIVSARADLETSVMAAGQLDLILGKVQLGKKLQGVIPQCGNEGIVSLKNAKHPLLLLRMDHNIVVGSDVSIGADGNQGLVLTGPNAGGKTVILKLLGLVALMARNGIPIPADPNHQPRVDFFSPVLADIGDLQSVGGDLSTFSGHMLVCKQVLESSGTNALVLMDELGSGTDPAQGVAIAQALLEELVEAGSRVVITTHYMELKQLAASDNRFAVAGMQFVSGRPTYKLLPGIVGESFALSVAERLGLPQKVIDRATALLDSETRQMGELLRELEDQRAVVDRQVEEMTEKKNEIVALQLELIAQQVQLEQKQLSARRDEAKKFAVKLEEKERVLEDILEKLKTDPSRKIIARSWEEIKFVKRDVINDAENVPSVVRAQRANAAAMEQAMAELVPLAELREKPDLQVGDTLQVCKPGALFGKEAIILELGSRLQVKVNGMSVRLKMTDLALPNARVTPAVSLVPKGNRNARAVELAMASEPVMARTLTQPSKSIDTSISIRTESNTVSVLGCNLEEAKAKAKDKFSRSIMAGRSVVYILHGHGERGVLKQKIRSWLQSERQLVKRFEPADHSDGGDALTKVELR